MIRILSYLAVHDVCSIAPTSKGMNHDAKASLKQPRHVRIRLRDYEEMRENLKCHYAHGVNVSKVVFVLVR